MIWANAFRYIQAQSFLTTVNDSSQFHWGFFHQVHFVLCSRHNTFFATIIAVLRHKKKCFKATDGEITSVAAFIPQHMQNTLWKAKKPKSSFVSFWFNKDTAHSTIAPSLTDHIMVLTKTYRPVHQSGLQRDEQWKGPLLLHWSWRTGTPGLWLGQGLEPQWPLGRRPGPPEAGQHH